MTSSVLPGSFTVVNCSSLYFWKAGPSSLTRFGSEMVRALMSVLERSATEGASFGGAIVEACH